MFGADPLTKKKKKTPNQTFSHTFLFIFLQRKAASQGGAVESLSVEKLHGLVFRSSGSPGEEDRSFCLFTGFAVPLVECVGPDLCLFAIFL